MAAQLQRRASAKVLASMPSGWRNSVMPPESVTFTLGEQEVTVRYRVQRGGQFWVGVADAEHVVSVCSFDGHTIELEIDGRRIKVTITADGERWLTHGPGGDVELVEQPRFPLRGGEGVAGGLVAPMPSNVLATHVAEGDRVEEGQLLMVVEAMKMEHRITAPKAGVVAEIRVAEGDQVANGELLIVLTDEEED
jgi:acetyl/propionyl-CoA carboxylase alpha subunit